MAARRGACDVGTERDRDASSWPHEHSLEEAAPSHPAQSLGALRAALLILCALAAFYAQRLMYSESSVFDGTFLASGAVAFFGSSVHPPSVVLGALGSLVVGMLFGMLSPSSPVTWKSASVGQTALEVPVRRQWTLLVLVASSLLLMFTAQLLYVLQGENLPVRLVWGMSVAAFTVAALLGWRARRPSPQAELSPCFSWASVAVFALIIGATLLLRVLDLEQLPHQLVPDVSHVGRFSRENLETGWRLFGVGFFGIPQISFSVTSLSMLVFGDNLVGLRMADVLLGTTMVAFVYLCVWRSLNSHQVAAVSAAVLGASAVHNTFSRHVFNLDPWAIFCVAAFLVIHGLRSRSCWLLGVAGVLVGFALQLYLSIRVLGAVLPCFVAYLAVTRPKLVWERRWGGLLFVLGVLVVLGPNLADIAMNQEMWQRSNRLDVSLFGAENLRSYMERAGLSTWFGVAKDRFVECLLVFQFTEDGSGQFVLVHPFLDPYVAPFMWLGLGVSIRNALRNPIYAFLVVCIVVTLAATEGISYVRKAAWPRVFWVLPISSIFIAVGICTLSTAVQRLGAFAGNCCGTNNQAAGRTLGVASKLAISVLLVVITARGWLVVRAGGARDSYPVSLLARFVANHPPGTKFCLVANNELNLEFPELLFMGHRRERKNITAQAVPEAVAECGDGSLVWIVNPADEPLAAAVRARFPLARFERHVASNGNPAFDSYSTL